MLKAERISCSDPKLSDAQTRNFEAIKHTMGGRGYRAVHAEPGRRGRRVSEKVVRRLMRERGLTAARRRRGTVKILAHFPTAP